MVNNFSHPNIHKSCSYFVCRIKLRPLVIPTLLLFSLYVIRIDYLIPLFHCRRLKMCIKSNGLVLFQHCTKLNKTLFLYMTTTVCVVYCCSVNYTNFYLKINIIVIESKLLYIVCVRVCIGSSWNPMFRVYSSNSTPLVVSLCSPSRIILKPFLMFFVVPSIRVRYVSTYIRKTGMCVCVW